MARDAEAAVAVAAVEAVVVAVATVAVVVAVVVTVPHATELLPLNIDSSVVIVETLLILTI
jgi:hypothetical protein